MNILHLLLLPKSPKSYIRDLRENQDYLLELGRLIDPKLGRERRLQVESKKNENKHRKRHREQTQYGQNTMMREVHRRRRPRKERRRRRYYY